MAEQTELLSQWSKHFEGLNQGVDPFYSAVESAVKKRGIPEVKFERVAFKEGGDLRYDICGAPFRNGFLGFGISP